MSDEMKEFYGRNIKEEILRMAKTSDVFLTAFEVQDKIIEDVARNSMSPIGRFFFDHSKTLRRTETAKYKVVHNSTGYDVKKDGIIVSTVAEAPKQIKIKSLERY